MYRQMFPIVSRSMRRPLQGNLLRQSHLARPISSKVHRLPGSPGEDRADFRAPWFYTVMRVLSWTIIPGVAFYAVFFYDFGDHEHVYQAPRRWAARKKAEFFSLTPEEKSIIEEKPESSKS